MAQRDKQYNKSYNEAVKQLKKELGSLPDLKLLETLYVPDIATEIIPRNDSDDDDDERGVYRIRIGDVVVRYFEDISYVTVTVEGELPPDTVERLKNDVMDKFTALEGAPIICQTIPFE